MNKSFLDDEETLNEMNEVKNLSINEILHGTEDNSDHKDYTYLETKEEKLEFERDFIALSERLINHDFTQEDAEKKAIVSMREYYTDDENGCKDKEIDKWLKEQENKYQIGSCYSDDEYYDIDNLSDHVAFEDQGSCYEENEYRDEAYDIPELGCGAGMSDEKLLDVCFETGPDLEIHDKQYFEEQI